IAANETLIANKDQQMKSIGTFQRGKSKLSEEIEILKKENQDYENNKVYLEKKGLSYAEEIDQKLTATDISLKLEIETK